MAITICTSGFIVSKLFIKNKFIYSKLKSK